MENRIALIGIIVTDEDSVDALNAVLHEYRQYIIGRMGVPYKERKVSIISLAVDAPQPVTSALSGKIGRLTGVNTKTIYADKQ